MPIYNVEVYLEECLRSIAQQSYLNLQVLLVDDGSKDRSAQIAQDFVKQDPRFELIMQPNAGLGAARNTGINRAQGDFLTFVDSDDFLPLNAYALMVEMLLKSGSDFVVGGIERLSGRSSWRDDWVNRVHGRDHIGITVDDLPEVTKNVSAWSKLYRTEFFKNVIKAYPVNLLNEDQGPAALGYARSKRFDVLARTTYFWRIRDDGTSITQSRLRLQNLEDRITAEESVSKAYQEFASPAIQLYRWRDFAGADFAQFYRTAPLGTDEYWQRISGYLRELFERLPEEVWRGVGVRERSLAYLISRGERSAALELAAHQENCPDGVPMREVNGRTIVDTEALGLSSLDWPLEIISIEDVDRRLRTGITNIYWQDETLLVKGFGFIQNLPGPVNDGAITLTLVIGATRKALALERFNFEANDPELPGTSYISYPESGLQFQLTIDDLPASADSCLVEMHYQSDSGESWQSPLLPQDNEHVPHLEPRVISMDEVIETSADRLHGLRLRRLTGRAARLAAKSVKRNALATVDVVFEGSKGVGLKGRLENYEADACQLAFISPDGQVRAPVSWAVNDLLSEFSAEFAFSAHEFSANANGIVPIYGLCVFDPRSTDPFDTARSVHFTDQSRNGYRRLVRVSDGTVEISDFGHQRSILIRGNQQPQASR